MRALAASVSLIFTGVEDELTKRRMQGVDLLISCVEKDELNKIQKVKL
jgi:hypothetical protein